MNTLVSFWLLISLAVALFSVEKASSFSVAPAIVSHTHAPRSRLILKSTEDESSDGDNTKKSLEEKMAGWEASEEEIRASTLGGVTPPKRSDAFDIGLYIAFPFMILASLAFAFFPFIMDKIDVSSVGPPPTV